MRNLVSTFLMYAGLPFTILLHFRYNWSSHLAFNSFLPWRSAHVGGWRQFFSKLPFNLNLHLRSNPYLLLTILVRKIKLLPPAKVSKVRITHSEMGGFYVTWERYHPLLRKSTNPSEKFFLTQKFLYLSFPSSSSYKPAFPSSSSSSTLLFRRCSCSFFPFFFSCSSCR